MLFCKLDSSTGQLAPLDSLQSPAKTWFIIQMNGKSTTATIEAVICSRRNSARSLVYWMAASSVRDSLAKKKYISSGSDPVLFVHKRKKVPSNESFVNGTALTRPPSLPRPFPAFPSICLVFTHLSRLHSSFAARASSHSTLPLGKSLQVNISRSLMLKGSDSGRYAAGRELPVPRATATAVAAHQNQGHCLCLRCFYPIKQQYVCDWDTAPCDTFTRFVVISREDTGWGVGGVADKAAIVM